MLHIIPSHFFFPFLEDSQAKEEKKTMYVLKGPFSNIHLMLLTRRGPAVFKSCKMRFDYGKETSFSTILMFKQLFILVSFTLSQFYKIEKNLSFPKEA